MPDRRPTTGIGSHDPRHPEHRAVPDYRPDPIEWGTRDDGPPDPFEMLARAEAEEKGSRLAAIPTEDPFEMLRLAEQADAPSTDESRRALLRLSGMEVRSQEDLTRDMWAMFDQEEAPPTGEMSVAGLDGPPLTEVQEFIKRLGVVQRSGASPDAVGRLMAENIRLGKPFTEDEIRVLTGAEDPDSVNRRLATEAFGSVSEAGARRMAAALRVASGSRVREDGTVERTGAVRHVTDEAVGALMDRLEGGALDPQQEGASDRLVLEVEAQEKLLTQAAEEVWEMRGPTGAQVTLLAVLDGMVTRWGRDAILGATFGELPLPESHYLEARDRMGFWGKVGVSAAEFAGMLPMLKGLATGYANAAARVGTAASVGSRAGVRAGAEALVGASRPGAALSEAAMASIHTNIATPLALATIAGAQSYATEGDFQKAVEAAFYGSVLARLAPSVQRGLVRVMGSKINPTIKFTIAESLQDIITTVGFQGENVRLEDILAGAIVGGMAGALGPEAAAGRQERRLQRAGRVAADRAERRVAAEDLVATIRRETGTEEAVPEAAKAPESAAPEAAPVRPPEEPVPATVREPTTPIEMGRGRGFQGRMPPPEAEPAAKAPEPETPATARPPMPEDVPVAAMAEPEPPKPPPKPPRVIHPGDGRTVAPLADAEGAILGVRGTETEVETPTLGKTPAVWAVVPQDSIITSHVRAEGFAWDPRYPREIQPRDYSTDLALQQGVAERTQRFSPARAISDTPSAVEGTAIVTADGLVLSGNGRVIAMSGLSPEQEAAYLSTLKAKAGSYGIDPAALEGIDRPRLVRLTGHAPGAEDTIRFARDTNIEQTFSSAPLEEAASLSRLLVDDDIMDMARGGTFAESIVGPRGEAIRREIERALPTERRPRYFRPTGEMTEAGKELVSNMILVRAVGSEVAGQLSQQQRRTFLTAAPQLLVASREPQIRALFDRLGGAAAWLRQNKTAPSMTVEGILKQGTMFSGARDIDPVTIMAAEFLDTYGDAPRKLVERLGKAPGIVQQTGGLFGLNLSPQHVLGEALGVVPRAPDGRPIVSEWTGRGDPGQVFGMPQSTNPARSMEVHPDGRPSSPPPERWGGREPGEPLIDPEHTLDLKPAVDAAPPAEVKGFVRRLWGNMRRRYDPGYNAVSGQDMVATISEATDHPINVGGVSPGNAAEHLAHPNVSLLRAAHHVVNALHEAGHSLGRYFFKWLPGQKGSDAVLTQLTHLGDRLYQQLIPTNRSYDALEEGIAELHRMRHVEPELLRQLAPDAVKAFDAWLDTQPAHKAGQARITASMQRYMTQGATARMRAQVMLRDMSAWDKILGFLADAARRPGATLREARYAGREAWVTRLAPIEQILYDVERREPVYLAKIRGSKDDPLSVAIAHQMTSNGMVADAVTNGVHGVNGELLAESLQKARDLLERKEWIPFTIWAMARRGVERFNGKGAFRRNLTEAEAARWRAIQETSDPTQTKDLREQFYRDVFQKERMWIGSQGDVFAAYDVKNIDMGLGTREQLEAIVARDSNTRWERAFDIVQRWNYAWIERGVQMGAVTKDLAEMILDGSTDYMPGFKIMTQEDLGNLRSHLARGNPLKRMRGGGEKIHNPWDAMIARAATLETMFQGMLIRRSLRDLSHKVAGLGDWIYETSPEVVARTRPLEYYTSQMKARGLDLDAIREMSPELQEQLGIEPAKWEGMLLSMFEPRQLIPGRDPILAIPDDDGTVRWYHVNAGLYRAVSGIPVKGLNWIAQLAFGLPTRIQRMSTTGVRAGFALFTNPLRDVATYAIQSKEWNPVALGARWLSAVVRSVGHELGMGQRSGSLAFWHRLGGTISGSLGIDMTPTRSLGRMLERGGARYLHRAMQAYQKHGWKGAAAETASTVLGAPIRLIRHPGDFVSLVREKMQMFENAPRAAEFERAIRAAGWVPGMTLTQDQAIRGMVAGKQVTVDFADGGNVAMYLNQMIPFFNVAFQGPRVFMRRMFGSGPEGLIRTMIAGTAAYTVPAILGWEAVHEQEFWKQMRFEDRYRYLWGMVGGTPFQIPMSQEAGIFAALPMMFLDYMETKDPGAIGGLVNFLVEGFVPGLQGNAASAASRMVSGDPEAWKDLLLNIDMPHSGRIVAEQLMNRIGHTGRPIVTEGQERQKGTLQRSVYTTGLATGVANAMDKTWLAATPLGSARRLDHLFRGFGGPTFMDILSATGLGPAIERDFPDRPSIMGITSDNPVFGRAIHRGGAVGSESLSVDRLYRARDRERRRRDDPDVTRTVRDIARLRSLEQASERVQQLMDEQLTVTSQAEMDALTRQMRSVADRGVAGTYRATLRQRIIARRKERRTTVTPR